MRGSQPFAHLEEHLTRRVAAAAGETLIAAVSGGPDSVALAALLAHAARRTEARVVLVHINHGVRESAWQDEAVVLSLGSSLRLRVLVRALEPGGADEQRLRDERYAALLESARELQATRIFTAHHAEDQTETVLLALFRGTGQAGVMGMPARRELTPGIFVERPLLRRNRAELLQYCGALHLPYARDPSNGSLDMRRNAVRAALVDVRRVFPRLDRAVARFAEIAQDRGDRAALRHLLHGHLKEAGAGAEVTFERLDAAARAIQEGHSGRIFIAPGVELHLGLDDHLGDRVSKDRIPQDRVSRDAVSKKVGRASSQPPGGS